MSHTKVAKKDLPNKPVQCSRTGCVYNGDGRCDSPRRNSRNADSECAGFKSSEMDQILRTGDAG